MLGQRVTQNPRRILAEILAEYVIEHLEIGLIERVCHRSSNITWVYTPLILPSRRNQRTPLE